MKLDLRVYAVTESDLDRRKISVLSAGGGFAGRGHSGAVKRKEAG